MYKGTVSRWPKTLLRRRPVPYTCAQPFFSSVPALKLVFGKVKKCVALISQGDVSEQRAVRIREGYVFCVAIELFRIRIMRRLLLT